MNQIASLTIVLNESGVGLQDIRTLKVLVSFIWC